MTQIGESPDPALLEERDDEKEDKPVDKVVDNESDSDKEEEEEEDDEIVVSGSKRVKKIVDDDSDSDKEEEEEDQAKKSDNDKDDSDEKDVARKDNAEKDDARKDDDDDEEEEEEDDEDEKEPVADEEEDEEEDEEGNRRREARDSTIYDFDIMMAKKKEENSRKRKRRNYDIINDNDDIIADIINQMKDAVEADREANENKVAATKKLKLLPFVMCQLRKVDLRDAFLDSDILSVLTEWLAPLPDRSLPHLNIRESLLKVLIDFNLYDVDRIKASGIGKAIMYLYKHPKETRENKHRAKKLISSWSRPIFQLDSSFTAISREEREQRDLESMNKHRRASRQDGSDGETGPSSSSNHQKAAKEETGAQKPGDKGWIPRARVPAPSMRDYVVRPRSKVDGDVGKSSKRPANMLEKYMRTQQEKRRASRQQRAVNMKIDRI